MTILKRFPDDTKYIPIETELLTKIYTAVVKLGKRFLSYLYTHKEKNFTFLDKDF